MYYTYRRDVWLCVIYKTPTLLLIKWHGSRHTVTRDISRSLQTVRGVVLSSVSSSSLELRPLGVEGTAKTAQAILSHRQASFSPLELWVALVAVCGEVLL